MQTSSSHGSVSDACNAIASPPPQPHLKLHQHALESIFGHLSFDELRSAVLVSPRWLEAVYAMRGIEGGKQLLVDSAEEITSVMQSRIARHVTDGSHLRKSSDLSQQQVQQILRCMPFLRELRFTPLADDEWSGAMRFPSTLHTIELRFPPISGASVNSLLRALSLHQPLVSLVALDLQFAAFLPAGVSFAPLQTLPALRHLTIHQSSPSEVEITHTQVLEMRALTQLEQLELRCDESTMLQLLEPPHQLQWTMAPYTGCITDAVAALLPTLPRLSAFSHSAFALSLTSLDFLAQLPALTSIRLRQMDGSRMDALLLALSVSLPQVISLTLYGSDLTTQQLRGLMSRLPNLRELSLSGLRNGRLTFLQPVYGTLRVLHLTACSISPESLVVLHSCSQLTDLQLTHSLSKPLDVMYRWALTPPSPLIPTLRSLRCKHDY